MFLALFGLIVLTGAFVLLGNIRVYAAPTVTVVIDAGHGGKSEDENETNSGAKYHDLEEKNLTLITAMAMYDELSQYNNVDVYLTRDIDAALSIKRRAEFASEVGADLLISIHYNASADHNFFGSEIFTSAYGKCYATGHAVAEEIMNEWVAEGNTKKDIKTRIGKNGDYYGIIRYGTELGIPTIILEHGYLDNDRDFQRIKTEDAWKNFGIMDATAVAKYYGLSKDVVKSTIGPEREPEEPEDPVMPDETEPEGVKLEINEYNSNKGNVNFTLYAYDDESKLMYYGFKTGDVDKDTVFDELELWDGKNGKLTGTYHLQPGFEGKLTAKVYNVYQLDSLSNTVELVPDEEAPDDEEDNAVVKNEEDEDLVMTPETEEVSEAEPEDDDWVIGGKPPKVDNSAIANAIEKNTRSKVKESYAGLVIAGLVGAIALAVALVVIISQDAQKRRRRKKHGGGKKDVFGLEDDDYER